MSVTAPTASTTQTATTSTATTSAATTSAATTSTATATGSGSSGALINSDFDTFLKMLTTQMQNQDPLNPMDSSDYAVQLATFSGVEQQTKTNDLLTGLSTQMSAMGLAQLSGWVGMEARTTEPVWFDGSPVTLSLAPETGAEKAVLVVKDSSGTEVGRGEVTPTAGEIQWAGTGSDGTPYASGQYSFTLESYKDGTLSSTAAVPAYGRITEARAGESGPLLVLEGGAEVASSAIDALRQPG
ncbi:flagellar hook capping FlgD N-terminal domain-containing protein [Acidimangrovimonas sediminis]|uniref:flagellar hook capping FlgD N-terminal domain-containing protein n=1 Tax=Acidimangrovimonas sediminis TaxID=2056283 RepID=UPI000C80C87F|nr:flagellar hook capping FlgD N-terminal domain-containing protein [Acidimangrovimonas sediminis]